MPLSHRQLDAFRMFMETGSVTAAAERLRVSQPAVSKSLVGLEYDLGLTLFTRARKRLVPTHDAQLLYREVERLFSSLNDIESFARDLRYLKSGELHIASAASLGHTLVADSLASFAAEHHKARIVFNVSTTVSQIVISQQVDLGFSLIQVQHPALLNEPLFHARGVCVVPKGHRLAGREAITAEDLRDEQFISFIRDSRMRHIIDATFEQQRISRYQQYEVFTSVEACALVSRGLGVSIVEPLGVAYAQWPDLWVARFDPAIRFTFNVMRPRHRAPSRLAEAYLGHLHKAIGRIRGDAEADGRLIELNLPT
ncbi:LysR substrate-binding domain-containing protein [Oceanibaculum nanhaiense]|uniref:LysR substrate-binding domain-containing protein n=1 Tax=Oceanibaculum nanhaiense TaxID=1909734 RepID=UPI00396D369B